MACYMYVVVGNNASRNGLLMYRIKFVITSLNESFLLFGLPRELFRDLVTVML